jgi:transcription antitermination factor NusG
LKLVADPWFALSVVPRKEKATVEALRSKEYEEFLPVYFARRKWSDRMKTIELPLFPGYVFCRFNPQARGPILMIPSVMSIVGLGKTPEPVADGEIEALQTICRSGLWAMPYPSLVAGSKIKIQEGPLRGLEGVLLEAKQMRLVVSVTLLQRSVAVEIERSWIAPAVA